MSTYQRLKCTRRVLSYNMMYAEMHIHLAIYVAPSENIYRVHYCLIYVYSIDWKLLNKPNPISVIGFFSGSR